MICFCGFASADRKPAKYSTYFRRVERTGSGKRWDPHGSLHNDGRFPEQLVTRPIASDEPRAFNVPCDPSQFSEVMEVPIGLLSSKRYETNVAIDATEPGGQAIITPGAQILAQRAFDDAIPWILVTVFHYPIPSP
jgi:hypothetical protein